MFNLFKRKTKEEKAATKQKRLEKKGHSAFGKHIEGLPISLFTDIVIDYSYGLLKIVTVCGGTEFQLKADNIIDVQVIHNDEYRGKAVDALGITYKETASGDVKVIILQCKIGSAIYIADLINKYNTNKEITICL